MDGGDSVRGPLVRQIVRDTVTFAQAAEFLASPDRLREVTVALQVLEHDGNATNRMIAAAILSRFPADPAAWTAVLAALTDRDDWVSGAAEHGLTFMMRQPSAGHGYNAPWPLLRTLVAGIRPGAVPDVLTVITNFATPEDARRAVAQNGHLVLALLESTRADWRTVAHRFLVAANDGRDLGPRASAWGAWIDGLAITPAGDAPSP